MMSSLATLDVAAVGGALSAGLMQWHGYSSGRRRQRLVGICRDRDFLRRTWDAYVNKELARARPIPLVRISFDYLARPAGPAST
jgi:geranylgeranyl reductase